MSEYTNDSDERRTGFRVSHDPAWFLDPVWQAGEREADADIAAGRGRFFESGEDFLQYRCPPNRDEDE